MNNRVAAVALCAFQISCAFVSTVHAQSENEILPQIVATAKDKLQKARYIKNCHPVEVGSPYWKSILADYQGLPVQDCAPKESYKSVDGGTEVSVNARALVLFPSPETIASMVINACKANGYAGSQLNTCADKTLQHIVGSNGGQFIISGVITEPKSEGYGPIGTQEWTDARCKETADEDVLFSFRDGSTVRLKGRVRTSWRTDQDEGCKALPQPSETELEQYLSTDPDSVKNYGRIADLHRVIFAACSGDASVVGTTNDSNWRALVKRNFIRAWSTGMDKLLVEWVRASFKPSGECKIR